MKTVNIWKKIGKIREISRIFVRFMKSVNSQAIFFKIYYITEHGDLVSSIFYKIQNGNILGNTGI